MDDIGGEGVSQAGVVCFLHHQLWWTHLQEPKPACQRFTWHNRLSVQTHLNAGTHSSLSLWQNFNPSGLMRAIELLLRNSCVSEVRPYREPLFTSVRLLYSRWLQRDI